MKGSRWDKQGEGQFQTEAKDIYLREWTGGGRGMCKGESVRAFYVRGWGEGRGGEGGV